MGTWLDNLTSEMSGLKGKAATLQVDETAVNIYLGKISEAQAAMQAQAADAQGLQEWLSGREVGSFDSAVTTKKHLTEDIQQFIAAVNSYANYLGVYHDTVAAACKTLVTGDAPK